MRRTVLSKISTSLTAFLSCIAIAISGPTFASDAKETQQPTDLYFEVMRGDSPMGFHKVWFSKRGDQLVVNTEIELRAKVAFITLFRYDHKSEEIWSNGQLVSMTSNTNDNGKKTSVFVEPRDGQLHVNGSGYEGPAPEQIIPSSYWNYDLVTQSQMLNTQTGEIVPVKISPTGEEELLISGTSTQAKRFSIQGTADLDVWYDSTKNWVRSKFTVRNTTLTYVLTKRGGESVQYTGTIGN